MLIEAYRANVLDNLPGVEAQLTDRELLRSGNMDYEIGALMATAYGYISAGAQDKNQGILLELAETYQGEDGVLSRWVAESVYQYALWIPRPFRSLAVVEFIRTWEDECGALRAGPHIRSWGGVVGSPVSRGQLVALDEASLIRLLRHYLDGGRYDSELLDQGLVGGTRAVRGTVRESAAFEPCRFLTLLEKHLDEDLALSFELPILEGIAEHLRYLSGTLSAPEGWARVADEPSAEELARALLTHAEQALAHPNQLSQEAEHSIARLLQAVADTTESEETRERLALALWRMVNSQDPEARPDEDDADFGMVSLNSVRGIVAGSAMTLLCRALKLEKPIPRLLPHLIRRLAIDSSLGVRASILSRIDFATHHSPDFGWTVFNDCFRGAQGKLWGDAEPLLYYQYRDSFDRVKPLLERLYKEAPEVAGDTYGRIATLAYLTGHTVTGGAPFLSLATNDSIRQSVAEVLCANLGKSAVGKMCRATLLEMLQIAELSSAAINALGRAMSKENSVEVDAELVLRSVDALTHAPQARDMWGVCTWLGRNCARDPIFALKICEKIVSLPGEESGIRFAGEMVPILLEILKEADETDDPALIARAVKLQDEFLRLEVAGVDELLDNSSSS